MITAVTLLLGTACGGDDEAEEKKEKGKAPSEAVVKIAPKDGAKNVATSGGVKITASKGKLTKVTVTDSKDREVEGTLNKSRSLWKPTGHLASSTKYAVNAVAKDSEGREAAESASFTTVVPRNTFIGQYTPEDGDKVGAGMPVSINFNRAITNREAVERAISVTAEPKVEIEGHWFGNQRLDFRPEEYWKKDTKVTLDLNLDGVEGAEGVYGKQRKQVSFTVKRHQVSVVDAKKKQMTVTRDGEKIKTIPITAGAPENSTYNGKMVISEKYKVTRMNGETVGFDDEYDIKDVPHAMRLSTSGTFIHGNYWAGKATFGSANVSHGCVGLFDQRGGGDSKTPAAWFYKNSIIGDVVEIKKSKDKTIQPDNGLNGWNMDWEKWKAKQ
ncbi:Ig-like domain-containing protein [Streptomyces sp. NPDC005438]|uniref:L,D-transpeptidase n=1 Tax=Streptomyces sp. NPDC005438 TaxID=3156880 RepID=UPI0033AE9573